MHGSTSVGSMNVIRHSWIDAAIRFATAPHGPIAGLLHIEKKKAARTIDADGRSLGRKRPKALTDSYAICGSEKTPGKYRR
jgi:hypothetical protein